jgi:retron-type reverse transcriptase
VDLRKYFDSIDPAKLRECLDRRVTDGVVRRLIDKWLKAGVFEDGQVHYPETGTPQGGVISPCLANVFLHYVLDEWFADQVQPRLRGPSTLVRFADDFVAVFACKDDAERVLRVGSQPTIITFLPASARAATRFWVVVDFPMPPLP